MKNLNGTMAVRLDLGRADGGDAPDYLAVRHGPLPMARACLGWRITYHPRVLFINIAPLAKRVLLLANASTVNTRKLMKTLNDYG